MRVVSEINFHSSTSRSSHQALIVITTISCHRLRSLLAAPTNRIFVLILRFVDIIIIALIFKPLQIIIVLTQQRFYLRFHFIQNCVCTRLSIRSDGCEICLASWNLSRKLKSVSQAERKFPQSGFCLFCQTSKSFLCPRQLGPGRSVCKSKCEKVLVHKTQQRQNSLPQLRSSTTGAARNNQWPVNWKFKY